jgi:hypothetical protein
MFPPMSNDGRFLIHPVKTLLLVMRRYPIEGFLLLFARDLARDLCGDDFES